MPKSKYRAVVISAIFDAPDISVGELAVYLALLKHRNAQTGKCIPSESKTLISDTKQKSKTTIIKHVSSLEDKGYIRVLSRTGTKKDGTGRNDKLSHQYFLFDDYPDWDVWNKINDSKKEKELSSNTANADENSSYQNNDVITNITDNVSESQPNATDLQLNSVANTTELTLDTLKELMNYTWLCDTAGRDSEVGMIDSVFDLIYEVYTQTQPEYKINNYLVKGEIVKSKLMKLTHYNIMTAVSTFLSNSESTEIRNHKSYLLTILYNISLGAKISGAVALNDAGL